MSARNKIITIDKGLIRSGVHPTFSFPDIPFWETSSNVLFKAAGVTKMKGWAEAFTGTTTVTAIRGILERHDTSGVLTTYFGYDDALWRRNASTTTDVGLAYLNAGALWSLTHFGDWIIATNGVETPQIYKGASFANMSGTPPTTAEIMLINNNHVLAFNTDTFPRGVEWSDISDPDDWVPLAANRAGNLNFREAVSAVRAAVPLGTRVAAYTDEQQFILTYRGDSLVYGYALSLNGIGALSKAAVVPVDRRNFGVGRQGFWMTDGNSFEYIDQEVRDEFFDNANNAQYGKVVGYHDEANTSVKWLYCSTGQTECDKGIAYNYRAQQWTLFDHAISYAIERSIRDNPIIGTGDGNIHLAESTNDADGSALTASVTSGPQDFGSPDEIKFVDQVRVVYSGAGLRIRVGVSDSPVATPTWGSYLELDQTNAIAEVRASGRYIHFELQSADTSDNWEVSQITVYGRGAMGETI